jgi:hypothetical protein
MRSSEPVVNSKRVNGAGGNYKGGNYINILIPTNEEGRRRMDSLFDPCMYYSTSSAPHFFKWIEIYLDVCQKFMGQIQSPAKSVGKAE